MKYSSVKGMDDLLPRDSAAWQRIESAARKNLNSHGFSEIRTPILEDTALFERGIGQTTDIVTKEMFTFQDRKGRSLTMRPEGTAPVVRAYIQNSLYESFPESRLYYIGPMFRAERPQKGRLRQFHQIGTEVIGTSSPFADAELIQQLSVMLGEFGLNGVTIKLNSLGCRADKERFAEETRKYLSGRKESLCEDCRARLDKNVLRILDCKKEGCAAAREGAPDILDFQCEGCVKHYSSVKSTLDSLGVNYSETRNLVRGLDYYTRTVFEVTHPGLGAQDAIGAGGRYDNLVRELGGPDIGAVGYALGMERILIALGESKADICPRVAIATLGDAAKIKGLILADKLRKSSGLAVFTDIKDASLKSQLRSFDKIGASIVIVIGEDELKEGVYTVKDMAGNTQTKLDESGLVRHVREYARKACGPGCCQTEESGC